MRIITSLDDFYSDRKTVAALGNFDGVHIGHREILLKAVRTARRNGMESVCFTFSTHTRENVSLICTEAEKMELLESLGIDTVVNIPFTKTIRDMPAEEFVHGVLHERLNAAYVCCGFNYHFGAKAVGNPELLTDLGAQYGMKTVTHDPVYVGDQIVSSTLVRSLIRQGDMERASVCLGRNFWCTGTIIRGQHVGTEIGFPTANILFESYRIAPPNGVYYTIAVLDGVRYPAITNVGVKPTVGTFSKSIETHIYQMDRELYGHHLKVEFLRMKRPEHKFESLEALKEQIAEDWKTGIEFHKDHGNFKQDVM